MACTSTYSTPQGSSVSMRCLCTICRAPSASVMITNFLPISTDERISKNCSRNIVCLSSESHWSEWTEKNNTYYKKGQLKQKNRLKRLVFIVQMCILKRPCSPNPQAGEHGLRNERHNTGGSKGVGCRLHVRQDLDSFLVRLSHQSIPSIGVPKLIGMRRVHGPRGDENCLTISENQDDHPLETRISSSQRLSKQLLIHHDPPQLRIGVWYYEQTKNRI